VARRHEPRALPLDEAGQRIAEIRAALD